MNENSIRPGDLLLVPVSDGDEYSLELQLTEEAQERLARNV